MAPTPGFWREVRAQATAGTLVVVTGESWATDDLGPLFTMFDLRRAVTRPES